MSRPPSATPSDGAESRPQRLDVAHLLEVAADRGGAPGLLVGGEFVVGPPAARAANACSAASIPDSMALCEPLMRGTLTKPAAQPISAPPGKASFGTDCQPPSVIARAP